jgi:hypothetical protein
MPNYRVLRPYEVNERESLIAQVVAEVANSILRIRLPGQSFIEETWDASDIKLAEPIRGLYQFNRIFLLKDLPDDTLVRTCAHELRHHWQFQTRRFHLAHQCERDAELFAREFEIFLEQPRASRIVERLLTIYGMKCRPISPYIKDVLERRL